MSASVWIRALQLFPYLEKKKIKNIVNEEESQADISIFVRRQSIFDQQLAVKQKNKGQKIIFDLCVNYFHKSKKTISHDEVTLEQISNCIKMTQTADLVFCSSEMIAKSAKKFNRNSFYLYDSIDFNHFNKKKKKNDFIKNKLKVIWSGVSRKSNELLPYADILKKNNIPLILLCEKKPSNFEYPLLFWKKYPTYYKRWEYNSLPHDLLMGDIMIAPRELSSVYNKGHSHFKINLFLSQGIPVIASPVPSYSEVLESDVNGKFINNIEEFENIITFLNKNPEVISNWSESALKKSHRFSTSNIINKYISYFNSL